MIQEILTNTKKIITGYNRKVIRMINIRVNVEIAAGFLVVIENVIIVKIDV